MDNDTRDDTLNRSSESGSANNPASFHSNRLIHEESPYLLQHAYNPVDWYPWGEEAFHRAASEDKPVFLSIGYSTCHWCHVMERESFTDQEVAEVLNRNFISIKVDREERPDIDHTYMMVCQMMNDQCGWPLNLVLTTEKEPFFAATYIPKIPRRGMVGLISVLENISEIWHSRRSDILRAATDITTSLRHLETAPSAEGMLDDIPLRKALDIFRNQFDSRFGGFGRAPKFPTPHHCSLLLRISERFAEKDSLDMALKTLSAIRYGGIFDQIGFGIHRYSVDEQWLVPHFEKMLYDQALIALAYLDAYQKSGDDMFAQSAREIFEYMGRDLQNPAGGFYCGEDADTEGEEGSFYLWTPSQIDEALGPDLSRIFRRCFNISEGGNFEGKNIPHLFEDIAALARRADVDPEHLASLLGQAREILFSTRNQRVRPHCDDKIIAGWNGLAIAALARGAALLGEERFLQQAITAAAFIRTKLIDERGRLLRRWRDGQAAIPAFLDDYTFVSWGLFELYQASFEPEYLQQAIQLTERMIELFSDGEGGFFDTGSDTDAVLSRGRSLYDGAIPAASSVAALNLLRLGTLLGRDEWILRGEKLITARLGHAKDQPMASSQLLIALDFALGPATRVVLAAREREQLEGFLQVLRSQFIPNTVIVLLDGKTPMSEDWFAESLPSLAAIEAPTAFVCQGERCLPPIHSAQELSLLLGEKRTPAKKP